METLREDYYPVQDDERLVADVSDPPLPSHKKGETVSAPRENDCSESKPIPSSGKTLKTAKEVLQQKESSSKGVDMAATTLDTIKNPTSTH